MSTRQRKGLALYMPAEYRQLAKEKMTVTSIRAVQSQELEVRLEAYHRNPDEGTSWATVLERIQNRA